MTSTTLHSAAKKGTDLHALVVQRFNQGNILKRTIFELIAQELLQTLVPDPSIRAGLSILRDMCTRLLPSPCLRALVPKMRGCFWDQVLYSIAGSLTTCVTQAR